MRSPEEIKSKIEELQEELDNLDSELEERAQDEDIEEMSPGYERLETEFDIKEKMLKRQIELLEWTLGE